MTHALLGDPDAGDLVDADRCKPLSVAAPGDMGHGLLAMVAIVAWFESREGGRLAVLQSKCCPRTSHRAYVDSARCKCRVKWRGRRPLRLGNVFRRVLAIGTMEMGHGRSKLVFQRQNSCFPSLCAGSIARNEDCTREYRSVPNRTNGIDSHAHGLATIISRATPSGSLGLYPRLSFVFAFNTIQTNYSSRSAVNR